MNRKVVVSLLTLAFASITDLRTSYDSTLTDLFAVCPPVLIKQTRTQWVWAHFCPHTVFLCFFLKVFPPSSIFCQPCSFFFCIVLTVINTGAWNILIPPSQAVNYALFSFSPLFIYLTCPPASAIPPPLASRYLESFLVKKKVLNL